MEQKFSSWREWDKHWLKTITRSSGFEWNFAKKVIQRVSGLSPNAVTPQKIFVSNEGRELETLAEVYPDSFSPESLAVIVSQGDGWRKCLSDQVICINFHE